MFRYLLPIIALVFLAACGDDDEDVPTDTSPTPSAASGPGWSTQYIQLGDARQLLTSLGLEGTSLSSAAYQCIQSGCPDEAPGDDSWGCLSMLPTGDPMNPESLHPDDPPGWYSVMWKGAFDEKYGSRPERVVHEPTAELEQRTDIACGGSFGLRTTAGDAVNFLDENGLEGAWGSQVPPPPPCPDASTCPIQGIPSDTSGCLSLSIYDLPAQTQSGPRPTVYVSWISMGGPDYLEGAQRLYHTTVALADFEAIAASLDSGACYESPDVPPGDPYDHVPLTDSIQATYWRLTEAPDNRTLKLQVAAGGGCDDFERIDVKETDDSVTLDAYLRHSSPGPDGACTTELKIHEATIELDEPLGDRELLGCAPPEIYYVDHDIDCAEPGHI